MQNIGAGLIRVCSSHLNSANDFNLNITWPKDKQKENINKYLHCTVDICAVSF